MRRGLPVRFWFEVIAGAIGVTMFVLTLITREWIEVLTGLDPDRGSGVIEVALSLSFIAIAAAAAMAARGNYRCVGFARHQL